MNRTFVISIMYILIALLFSCKSNKSLDDKNNFNKVESLNLDCINNDKLKLTFNTVVNVEEVQRLVEIMSKNNDNEDLKGQAIDFLSNGTNVDSDEPWSYMVKLEDSTLTQNSIKILDSLKILPSNWEFCWSSYQPSAENKYEIIIIVSNNPQANILNGSDIDKIEKVYDTSGNPELCVMVKESGKILLGNWTRENIGRYLAIVSDNRFYIYNLIEYEYVNSITFK